MVHAFNSSVLRTPILNWKCHAIDARDCVGTLEHLLAIATIRATIAAPFYQFKNRAMRIDIEKRNETSRPSCISVTTKIYKANILELLSRRNIDFGRKKIDSPTRSDETANPLPLNIHWVHAFFAPIFLAVAALLLACTPCFVVETVRVVRRKENSWSDFSTGNCATTVFWTLWNKGVADRVPTGRVFVVSEVINLIGVGECGILSCLFRTLMTNPARGCFIRVRDTVGGLS